MSEQNPTRRMTVPAATLVFGLLAGGLAAWGYQEFSGEAPPASLQVQSDGASEELGEALNALRQEVAALGAGSTESDLTALRADMAALKQELARLQSGAAPPAELTDPELLPEESEATEEAEQTEFGYQESLDQAWAETDAYFAEIDRDFDAEADDPQWAGEAKSQLRDAFATAEGFAGTTLGEVECRASRCRLEVILEDELSAGEMEVAILDTMAESMEGMAIHYLREMNDGSPSKAIVYLSRKGHRVVPEGASK